MQKLLIPLMICSAALAGCSTTTDWSPAHWGIVHHIEIQQGNVIDQENLNRLELGMDERQVRYLMGKPLLQDVFHRNRWDYVYWRETEGGGPREQHRVSLFFTDDKLARIEGDMRPQPGAAEPEPRQQNLLVPPRESEDNRGILTRLWQALFRADVGI